MYALLAREIMNALGEKGERIVREATRRYGKDRGRTRREKHEALGVKINMHSLFAVCSDLPSDPRFRRDRLKLTDEERNSLVILQLEKAKVFLKQADEMFDLKYWDIASNRYYYACFHAVQALLIQNGLSCKTHDGLIACFGLNFIKTGKISARLGSFLARMEQLRQKGDYNCIYSISEDEISTIKAPARELIETIEVLLAES